MKFYNLLFLVVIVFALTLPVACSHDDDVPRIDTALLSKSELKGGWGVVGTDVKWDLTNYGNVLNNTYSFKSKVANRVSDEASYHSFFFTDTILFYIRYNPAKDTSAEFPYYLKQSRYTMSNGDSGYYITLENTDLLGYYCDKLYIKYNEAGQLVFYLQKPGVVKMMEEEYSGFYQSTITKNINSAEIDMKCQRDSVAIYADIIRDYGY